METGIKSSFIPQSPITPTRMAPRSRGGGMDFFFLLALVLFVASATLAVGVFLYVQFLSTSAGSKLEQLERAKAAFEPALIEDLTRLDDRMRAGDVVLSRHVAPTALFHLLEQLTLQTVAFSGLDFQEDEKAITLEMQGVAQSVNSIALQADLLSKSGVIVNPIFSNINRQPNGVNFDFSADIDASKLRYQTAIIAPAPQAAPQEPASPFGETAPTQQPQGQTQTQTPPPQQGTSTTP